MKHFDVLIDTHIYENMDYELRNDLRCAYDILMSECTGLGNNLVPVSEIEKGNIRAATNNIYVNYERFMYRSEQIELMCDFLDIPLDRFIFFKNVMNMIARCNRCTTKVW